MAEPAGGYCRLSHAQKRVLRDVWAADGLVGPAPGGRAYHNPRHLDRVYHVGTVNGLIERGLLCRTDRLRITEAGRAALPERWRDDAVRELAGAGL